MGTPRYMSPEQHRGGKRVDALSDQYSFALALYEALAKSWRFGRKRVAPGSAKIDALRVAKVRGAFATPERALPSHVRRALQRALSADPGERFPSMPELLEELEKDPARARRRGLAVAAVALSVCFASWSAVAGRDEGRVALCQGANEELAETWNPESRAAIQKAFLATGVSYAKGTFERVASTLDDYGKDWVDMRTQACEATHLKGLQSEKVLDLRMACLDRKRRSLQALIGLFTNKPDRQAIDKAVEASLGLGGLAFCADTKALEQVVEPPEKPEDRRILAQLSGRLEEVKQLFALAKYREAQSLIQELAPRVKALGFSPLQAEFAFVTAKSMGFLGKFTEAETLLKQAMEAALQSGMNDLAAWAGATAIYVVGYNLQRYGEGQVYATLVQGIAGGRGNETEATSLVNLASVFYAQGHYEKAEKLDKRALAIREKLRGPEHPDVALSLKNLAVDYDAQGTYAEAELLYKRALAIQKTALGNDHPNVAMSLNNLAEPYSTQGKHAEAELLYKRALAIHEKALGLEHHSVALVLYNLANCYSGQGKHGEAEPLYKRSHAIFESALGSDHLHVAYPMVGLAETYEKQRQFAEALPLLERARAIREKAKVAPRERGDAAFALVRILWFLGKDRARARALAQEALALFQAAGPAAEKKRLELEKWLATHR